MASYNRLSLSWRLTAVALLALIPLAVLIVVQNLDRRDDRRDAGIGEATAFGQELATALESFANEIESFTDAAAISIGRDDEISQEATGGTIRSLLSRYPLIRAIFVTDLEGRILVDVESNSVGLDLSSRPYITVLQAGAESAWTAAVPGIQTGLPTASFSRVIAHPDGTPRAYLVASFQPTNLDESVLGILEDDANLVLIDSEGQIFYSARDTDDALQDVIGSRRVQAALAGAVTEINGEGTPFDEGTRYGAIVPVDTMGWAVAYTRSMSTLTAALAQDLLRDLGILALTVGIVAIVIGVLARQMTRPLSALATSAGQLAEGDEVEVALPANTNAAPEVVQLQQAFAGMVAAVREREARLKDQAEQLRSLEQAGATITASLDHGATVQAVTDAGTQLTGAEFGAFFYNVQDENGESYMLNTLSGIDKQAFANYPMPRATAIFAPTFNGEGIVRLDDVTKDPRYGQNQPYYGKPQGHPPVRSYLAVPVFGAGGEVLGGLFFGHSTVGVFTEHHEALAVRVASWASIALDNVRLYEQARTIQEELRLANLQKDEFLGLISHELRTPVTTIYGGLRLLDSHNDLLQGEQGQEFIETMADEGARLVRLIEDLLALTRVELGREIDRSPANVNALVEETVDDFVRHRKLRKVSMELAKDLPYIEVEPTYFRQILTNLLSNADKYSPDESPVIVRTALQGDEVQIVVSDSGSGVDPAEVDRIFDSFYRSEKTAGKAPGQGLGLTVCRKLVEAQQGRIWAQNRESGGLDAGFAFHAAETAIQEDEERQAGARS